MVKKTLAMATDTNLPFTRSLQEARLFMTTHRGMKTGRLVVLSVLLTLIFAVSHKVSAQCIPVESEVVRNTCGGCHLVDSHRCMSRISNLRKTPEGWEDTVRRMGRTNGVPSSASQAREIIGYLADNQGLSSSEASAIAYAMEGRRNVVENVPNEDVEECLHPLSQLRQNCRRAANARRVVQVEGLSPCQLSGRAK